MVQAARQEDRKGAGEDSDEDLGKPTVKVDRTQTFDQQAMQQARSQTIAEVGEAPKVRKAGTILSPHLEQLDTGGMIVELDNMNSATRGDQPLTGKVKIYLSEPFEPEFLTMQINGFLRSQVQTYVPSKGEEEVMRLAKTLVNVEYRLATFEEGIMLQGMIEFPFQINLPEEVTESLMVNFNNRMASQSFFLRTQVMPKNEIAFTAQSRADVSVLRTDMPLLIYQPDDEGELMQPGQNFDEGGPEELTRSLEMKVGGLGLLTSEAKAKIWLEKKKFHPGETARIHVNVDNTKCKKAVQKFKTKLKRKITVFNGKEGDQSKPVVSQEEYIDIKKHDISIKEKIQEHKVIEYKLPTQDQEDKTIKGMHPDLRFITNMLTFSASNSLFKIEYQLEVFVKHASKLEFGVGNFVALDIEIRGQGEEIELLKPKVREWMEVDKVPAWNPDSIAPTIYCDHVKTDDGKFTGLTATSLDELEEEKKATLDPNYVPQLAQSDEEEESPQQHSGATQQLEEAAREEDEEEKRRQEEQQRLEREEEEKKRLLLEAQAEREHQEKLRIQKQEDLKRAKQEEEERQRRAIQEHQEKEEREMEERMEREVEQSKLAEKEKREREEEERRRKAEEEAKAAGEVHSQPLDNDFENEGFY